jgi:hypothetical protein
MHVLIMGDRLFQWGTIYMYGIHRMSGGGGPFMTTQVVLGDHLCRGTS